MWYGITFLVGIGLIGASFYVFSSKMALLKHGEVTTATVVEVKRITDSDGYSYRPVYRYVTRANEVLTHEPNYSSNPSNWEVGEVIQAVYDPNDPAEVTILTYFGTFGVSAILLAVGVAAIIMGGGYYLASNFLSSFSQK